VLSSLVVIAAAIVVERAVARQQAGGAGGLLLRGGKPEPGESDDACLSREIAEELNASVATRRLFAVVSDVAALEGTPMEMTV
jgi:8-oxo-dGTP diphosphatase